MDLQRCKMKLLLFTAPMIGTLLNSISRSWFRGCLASGSIGRKGLDLTSVQPLPESRELPTFFSWPALWGPNHFIQIIFKARTTDFSPSPTIVRSCWIYLSVLDCSCSVSLAKHNSFIIFHFLSENTLGYSYVLTCGRTFGLIILTANKTLLDTIFICQYIVMPFTILPWCYWRKDDRILEFEGPFQVLVHVLFEVGIQIKVS